MLFLKVPRAKGEEVRRDIIQRGLFAKGYPILSEEGFVLFPISRYEKGLGFDLVQREAEPRAEDALSLGEALRGGGILSDDELSELTTSFDIIGDIAIIEIPKPLEAKEKEIGQTLLKVQKNIKTVLKKLGPMEGEFRVRKVACIAGEDRTTTIYKESGASMELDVAKVYFSVRLSHERTRIASLVKPKERILALFAGVGPFPLVIAKTHPNDGIEIVAIELNPDAVSFMEKNIRRNRAKNIKAVLGDAREVVFSKYKNFADRVLMPLPKGAHDFLDVAFAGVKDGGVVHFYTFADISDPFAQAIGVAEKAAKANGVKIEVANQRIVRPYSPQTVQVVLDLVVRKFF
jgi:tRNA (guanine37-N1)-methyltransferase